MSLCGRRRVSSAASDHGSTLFEAIAATAMSAVLVSALTGVVLRGSEVLMDAAATPVPAMVRSGGEAWQWCDAQVVAVAREGYRLVIQTDVRDDTAREVGVWVGGWFLGSFPCTPSGEARVTLLGLDGTTDDADMTIRARVAEGGAWGVPWRISPAESDGNRAAREPAPTASPPVDGALGTAQRSVLIVHAAESTGSPVSWTGGDAGEALAGTAPLVLEGDSGPWRIFHGSRAQSSTVDPGEVVHVFF